MKIISTFLIVCGALAAQSAQAPNPMQSADLARPAGSVPVYRVTVVARTTTAINYNHRSGSTHIDFRGTGLMPDARGEAKVESKQGVIKIDARMDRLQPATKFGPEYLTYVMWAITPEGRATNVGEVLLNGDNSKLDATTELQSFGLIITAEPYFAVTQPSDVVVMENFVNNDTVGTIEHVDAKFELLQRGQYTLNVSPADVSVWALDSKVPIELYEARNAVRIARWTGAATYAPDTYQKAVDGLANAEGYLQGRAGKKPIGTVAREAVQMAEDARIITVKKIAEEQLASERQAGTDREAVSESARVAAQANAAQVTQEAAMAQVAALSEAERLKRENDAKTLAAENEADRLKQANSIQMAAVQAEADRLKAENDAKMTAAQGEADRLKKENDEQRATAQADLDRATKEKSDLRAQLLLQFNAILQTRETARGLIVNMSGVLFQNGKALLVPAAREKLAKIAGILSTHKGLMVEADGFTDSTGSLGFNQRLSEQRAGSAMAYLVEEGVAAASISSKGFGVEHPIASNTTNAGRQENRRVELVISGEGITTR